MTAPSTTTARVWRVTLAAQALTVGLSACTSNQLAAFLREEPLHRDALYDNLLLGLRQCESSDNYAARSANRRGHEPAKWALKGVNLAALVRQAKDALTGGFTAAPTTASDDSNKTDFTELSGTFTISNGVVSKNDHAVAACARGR